MRVSATPRSRSRIPRILTGRASIRSLRRPLVSGAATAATAAAVALMLPTTSHVMAAEPAPHSDLTVCLDLGVVLVDLGCPTPPPATNPPATNPPATSPPATNPPATNPPATNPPATNPPATNPPATNPPATNPPATNPPATNPPATNPPATNPPAILPGVTLPALPGVGGLPDLPVLGGVGDAPLIDGLEIETPILNCTLSVAILAATADCNLGILTGVLPGVPLPNVPKLPPVLGLDLNALIDLPLGVVNAQGVVDTDGGIGGSQPLTGDVCLDVAVLAPTAGACPEADGIGDPASLAVVDACANIAVLAELPAECVVPDDDGGLVDVDACAGIAIGPLTPQACAQADVLDDGDLVDVCLDVDLVQTDPSECAAAVTTTTPPGGSVTTTTAPGGSVTTTTAPGGSATTTTAPGGSATTTRPGDQGGDGAGDPGGGGGNGARPSHVERGSLPMTGIAIAGTVVLAGLLVVTGAGARLLARFAPRR